VVPIRRPILRVLVVLTALLFVSTGAASPAAAASARSVRADTAESHPAKSGCRLPRGRIAVGGRCGWVGVLRFGLGGSRPSRAVLRLSAPRSARAALRVQVRGARASVRRRLGRNGALAVDISRMLPASPREVVVTVKSRSRRTIQLARAGRRRPTLEISATPRPVQRRTAPPAAKTRPPSPVRAPDVPAPTLGTGTVWIAAGELAARPTSGPAWDAVKAAADGPLGTANIADQDSDHDVRTLAVALVFARTGVGSYRAKAAQAISAAIGTEAGGRTLALGRNLASYVIAADLIDLGHADAALDARFRAWLDQVRREPLEGRTLISTHEDRPNNWGTMAGASRIAAGLYLGDAVDVARAATVLRGYLGDRSAYAGFDFGELSWQADPLAPVGVNPPGVTRAGLDIGGALPDDMRRGCAFTVAPCHTGYAWEALQGVLVEAELLSRHGYPAFAWGDNAVLRAVIFLRRLDVLYGDWWAVGDDAWQPWLVNHAYGTALPAATPARHGKVLGWTDWVYGA
jgi:hypothetical protein